MKIFVTGDKGYLGSEFIKKYGGDYEIVGFDHIDISKARNILGYNPEKPNYVGEQIRSTLEDKAK